MAKQKTYWPSWRYGPDGQQRIFQREEDVPDGWMDHPSKLASGMTDLAVEQKEGREALAAARGEEAAARERIWLAQIEERRRTGSNTAADNLIRVDPNVAEKAEKQQAGARTAAQAGESTDGQTGRGRNGDDSNDLGTVKEIRAGLESGKFTLDQVEEAEKKRETPRSTILELVERERAKASEEEEIVTREEAIAELRKHDVEISDDATDAEIEAALNKLEG